MDAKVFKRTYARWSDVEKEWLFGPNMDAMVHDGHAERIHMQAQGSKTRQVEVWQCDEYFEALEEGRANGYLVYGYCEICNKHTYRSAVGKCPCEDRRRFAESKQAESIPEHSGSIALPHPANDDEVVDFKKLEQEYPNVDANVGAGENIVDMGKAHAKLFGSIRTGVGKDVQSTPVTEIRSDVHDFMGEHPPKDVGDGSDGTPRSQME